MLLPLTALRRLSTMMKARGTQTNHRRLLVRLRDSVFRILRTTLLPSHRPRTHEILVRQDTHERPLQCFFTPLLQSETHPRLQRVDVRLVLHDLGQQVLGLSFPIALRLDTIDRTMFILTTTSVL